MNDLSSEDLPVPATEAIEAWLCCRFREALGQSDLAVDEGFLASGGDSLTAVETILEIEAEYGVTLSTAEFMALDTAQNLAQHITQNLATGTRPKAHTDGITQLSEVQGGDQKPALVCAYGLSGSAPFAMTLAKLLPDDQPVAAAQVRAEVVQQQGLTTFADTAQSDAANIVRQYPTKNHALLGFSLGAHVALSVGHELIERHAPPRFIVVMDDDAELDQRNFGILEDEPENAALPHQIKAALHRSTAKPISARLIYFRAEENAAYYRSDPTSGWGEIATGGVVCADVPTHHLDLASETGLRHVAAGLVDAFAKPPQAAPDPSDAQMLRYEARLAARRGDLATELDVLQRVIESDRDQPSWVFANLAEALFQKGDVSCAVEQVENARRQDNWPLTTDLRFARLFRAQGVKDQTERMLIRLRTTHADHPSVHDQKARIYLSIGLPDACARELKMGLSMQADHLRLSRLHLKYLKHQGAWQDLRDVAEGLVETFPGASGFRTMLIQAYLKTGTPDHALQFRKDFAGEGRFDYKGLIWFGRCLLRCGHAEEALQMSEQAIAVAPSRPVAYVLRAKCLRSLRRVTGAARSA